MHTRILFKADSNLRKHQWNSNFVWIESFWSGPSHQYLRSMTWTLFFFYLPVSIGRCVWRVCTRAIRICQAINLLQMRASSKSPMPAKRFRLFASLNEWKSDIADTWCEKKTVCNWKQTSAYGLHVNQRWIDRKRQQRRAHMKKKKKKNCAP